MKVLVVEDDPNLRALWGAVFRRVGHAARLEQSEAAARGALGQERFDLVLLDLYLGADRTIDVAAFAALLGPETKIVVVTGSTLYAQGELFALVPAVAAVLRKPVDIEDLIAVCEHIESGLGPVPAGLGAGATVEYRP
jgi:DNA-binding NtrC family response regulator